MDATCQLCHKPIGDEPSLRRSGLTLADPDKYVHRACYRICPICSTLIADGEEATDLRRPVHRGECADTFARRLRENEDKKRRDRLRARFDSEIAQRLARLPDFRPTFGTPEYESAVKHSSLRRLVAYRGDRNLAIFAPSGAGKTVTATAIVQNLVPSEPELVSIFRSSDAESFGGSLETSRYSLGLLESFVYCTGFELAHCRRNSPLGAEPQLLVDCKRASFLVLDDFCDEPLSDGILKEVLNARVERARPTMLTSGLDQTAFIDRYGDAVYRRLTQSGIGLAVEIPFRTATVTELRRSK